MTALPNETPHKFHVSWKEFHRDTRALAWNLPKQPWKGLVSITRGGLVPSAIIARELDIRLIDTVCIISYDDLDTQKEAETLKPASSIIESQGKDWLIIDDLVDTGETASIVRDMLPQAYLAAVYAKPAGRPIIDSYVTEVSQDTWIVLPWETDGE